MIELHQFLLINTRMNVEDQKFVSKNDLNKEADKGSFTNTWLTHYDNGNVRDCSLDNETHLEKVIQCDTIIFNVLS